MIWKRSKRWKWGHLGEYILGGPHWNEMQEQAECYPELYFPALSDFRFQGVSPFFFFAPNGSLSWDHQVGSWYHGASWPRGLSPQRHQELAHIWVSLPRDTSKDYSLRALVVCFSL